MRRRAGGVFVVTMFCGGIAGGQEPPGASRGWYAPETDAGSVGGTAPGAAEPKRICFHFDPLSSTLDDTTFAKAQQMGISDPDCPGGVRVTRDFREGARSRFRLAAPLGEAEPTVPAGVTFAGLLFNVKLEKGTVRVVLLRRKKNAGSGQITHLFLEPLP